MGGIRFEDDGRVTIITGTLDYGQGHLTTLSQILGERLGIPFDRIALLQGDSDELLFGGGTGGSRSTIVAGAAVLAASEKVIENGRQLAGWALETSAADIEFSTGRFSVVGTDRGIDVIELARRVREAKSLPNGLPTTLDIKLVHDWGSGHVPERMPRLRGRDRGSHRHDDGGQIHDGQRHGHRDQPVAARGPVAWRRGARYRPGLDGAGGL